MDRQLWAPINLTYKGNDTDLHRIDVVQVGYSLSGTGKLYNSVLHYLLLGKLPARNSHHLTRTYVGVPQDGCLTYILTVAAIYGQMAAHPEVVHKVGEFLFNKLIAAIFAKRTKQHQQMDKALDLIQELHRDHHDLAKISLAAAFEDRRVLTQMVGELATINRKAMAEMAAPIGNTCRTLTHFDKTDNPQVIDEPTAIVMRSQEDLQVGAQMEVTGTVVALDVETGSCRVRLAETGEIKRGKITDPSLKAKHNVYTIALDNKSLIILSVKPVLENEQITKLYVSDAKPAVTSGAN